ncbi:MAG: tyrosine--tRNA ligase, partial [Bacteroidota bacterium]
DELSAAQILYPCMQCADIFFLRADICQLGMDQRKVNMLAREYCDATRPRIRFKPVILSHHMLAGLKEGQTKMSKSDPDSAIFMEDEAADVKRKIKKAFCPPQVVEGNPILDYCKHVLMPYHGSFTLQFKDDREDQVFTDYNQLEADYVSGEIHPGDLKASVTVGLNSIL